MIAKQTQFRIESMEIIDSSMMKLAGVGIPADETYDPDFLYIRVRAVSAGEYYGDNKNGDWFPEEELKNSFTTFLSGHVFKNHENKDAAAAIGEVLDSEWDNDMKCVCLVLKIDKKIAPSVARAIEKGYMTDVSMGCRVPYSICSICGNKARNPREYCEHIRTMRRKILSDGRKVFEINIQPKFHDISVVLNGAEKVAKVTNIFDENSKENSSKITPIKKIAEDTSNQFEKVASFTSFINDAFEMPHYDKLSNSTSVEKTAAFEKKIRGLILGEAKSNLLQKTDLSRQILKAIFTPYWDDRKIKEINMKLKVLAIKNKKPLPVVFHEFIHVLNFAGIELSPREFTLISNGVFAPTNKFSPFEGGAISAVKMMEGLKSCEPKELSLAKALGACSQLDHDMPMKKIRVIIKQSAPVDNFDGLHKDIMDSIVGKLIPMRSVHCEPLIRRIRVIRPMYNNNNFGTGTELSNLLYSLYQKDRVNDAINGYTTFGMRKFASYFKDNVSFKDTLVEEGMQKEAGYNKYKAAVFGTPLIFGYSKLQQARMKNKAEQGEDNIHPINRMVAEYPEAVAGLNVLFGPKIYKEIKTATREIKKNAGPAIQKIKNKSLIKKASVYEPIARMYSEENYDMADNFMNTCGVTQSDFVFETARKIAEEENNLMSEFLKTAETCVDMEDNFYAPLNISNVIMKKIKNCVDFSV